MKSKEDYGQIPNEQESDYLKRMEMESNESPRKKTLNNKEIDVFVRDLDGNIDDMSRKHLLYYRHILNEALKNKESKIQTSEDTYIEKIKSYIDKINNTLDQQSQEKKVVRNKTERYKTFEIGEYSLNACIDSLNEALSSDENDSRRRDDIEQFKKALELALKERVLLYQSMLNNPDTEFKDSGNIVADEDKISKSIHRIVEVLKKISPDYIIPTVELKENVKYNSISNELTVYLNRLNSERSPELESDIKAFISENEDKIRSLINSIRIEDRNNNNDRFAKLTKDLILLTNLKKEVNDKVEVKPKTQHIEFKNIDLTEELSSYSLAILNTNPALLDKITKAVNIYNQKINENIDNEQKTIFFKDVEKLRLEFLSYKKDFLEKRAYTSKPKRNGHKADKERKRELYGKIDDIVDQYPREDSVDEDIRVNRSDLKSTIKVKDKVTAPVTTITPEAFHTSTGPTHLKQSEIFKMEIGRDYGNMIKDKKFDKWLKDTYELMVLNNEATETYSADIEYWYSVYQIALPYIDKLNSIFDDINRNNNKTTSLMSKLKIKDILYELYRNPVPTTPKIKGIIESYNRTKENEEKIAGFKKIEALKTAISDGTDSQTLKPEEVKSILESDSDKKIEHLSNLKTFLRDMLSNYDFYNSDSKDESYPNNIYYTFRKWKAAGKTQPEKPLGFWGKAKARLFASLPQNLNTDELNNFELLIKELRKSNLVDRKNGAVNGNADNKAKLSGIIDLINEYITNPDTIESTLNEEGKEKMKVVESLYKNFSDIYYKSPKAKEEAQQKLDNNRIDIPISAAGPEAILDTLFETNTEKQKFENEAKYFMSKESLKILETEIDNFPQARNPEKLKRIADKFTEIKSIIESLGDGDTDILELNKIGLRIKELIIKNLKKDNYDELSAAFSTYSEIINSTEITKEKKVEYLTTLINSLRTHRVNPENTLLQNVTLDAIIEKYQRELTKIQ